MQDEEKTKEQLVTEVKELRRRLSECAGIDYRALIEQMPAIVYTAGLSEFSTTLFISPQIEEFLGYSSEEYRADPEIWYKRLHPEDRARVLDALAICHQNSQTLHCEYRMIRRDGNVIWFRDDAVIVKDKDGQPLFLQGVMYDITVWKQTETALNDQVLFLQTMIDNIPSPIFYKDRQGRYMGCNEAFEEFIGLTREKIVGRTVHDIAPADLAKKYEEMDSALFENPGWQVYEALVRYADGNRHDIIFSKGTFYNAEGEVSGLVGVMLDISELRTAEKQLKAIQQDLEKRVEMRTEELVEANEKLRKEVIQRAEAEGTVLKSAEALKVFAYSIVHDLKSPITGIYALTQRLKNHYYDILDEKGRLFCDQIMLASELVAALVTKINTYISTKESPLNIETVNVSEVLGVIRDEFSAQLDLRRIEWIEPKELIQIRADHLSFVRVFRNLVENALKYGGDGLSRIEISYLSEDDCHMFKVSDNGAGLEGEDTDKIFQLFQRKRTKGVHGVGLGLAIVSEIVKNHSGRIWVDSTHPQNTAFCISIPKTL